MRVRYGSADVPAVDGLRCLECPKNNTDKAFPHALVVSLHSIQRALNNETVRIVVEDREVNVSQK